MERLIQKGLQHGQWIIWSEYLDKAKVNVNQRAGFVRIRFRRRNIYILNDGATSLGS